MPRVVHAVRGSSAAGTFRLSGIASGDTELFTMNDTLSCGPLLPIADISSWKEHRAKYWRSIYEGPDDESDEVPFGDPAAIASAEEIQIWLTTELADQIGFVWMAALLRSLDVDPARLKAVQFHRSERGREILGLGMLNPQQLAAHPPATSLTPYQIAELEAVWKTLTSPEPDGLLAYLRAPATQLPFLKRALGALPLRYPDSSSGVNAKELELLRLVRGLAPKTTRILGMALADSYDAILAGTEAPDAVGDQWLFSRMLRLGDPSLSEPALDISGSQVEYRDTEVRLTPFGQRVIEGTANFVDANGIDDWVAGVHLQSDAGRVWFHEDGQLVRRG
jgi:hypothetical protein